jgi:hypothetical protein
MELYSADSIPIEAIYAQFLDALEQVSEVDNATLYETELFSSVCRGIVDTMSSHLATFFNMKRDNSSGKHLEIISLILGAIYASPILGFPSIDLVSHVQKLLVGSLTTRFQNLELDSKKSNVDDYPPLVRLVDALQSELDLYHREMDVVICG